MAVRQTDDVTAALARIEERQAKYEIVALRILGCLEIHNEKLDAILAAALPEAGPSPVQELLASIVASLGQQTAALEALPGAIIAALNSVDSGELGDDDTDVEGAGQWDADQ